MITVLILIAHFVISVVVALRIIYGRHSGSAALAWLAVLFAFPIFGLVAYLLIGEPKLGRKRAARASEMYGFYCDAAAKMAGIQHEDEVIAKRFRQLARFGRNVAGFGLSTANHTTLLDNSDEILNAFKADIEAAKVSCLLEFYIVDGQGRVASVLEALTAAAQRGVRCQLLADALGSQDFWLSDWPDRLRAAGVEVCEALSVRLIKSLWVRSDLRNHRKILIVDYRVAYTGSYNLVDPALFKQDSGVGEWVDAMMRIEGAAVPLLASVFHSDWAMETDKQLCDVLDNWGVYMSSQPMAIGNAQLQVFPSQPDSDSYPLYDALVYALHNARHRVVMTTPYFVPDESLMNAMMMAVGRGVEVVLVMPEKVDSQLVYYASNAYLPQLLEAGVQVMRFQGGLLHTKSVQIDGEFAMFGTVNMDMRSFYLNLEVVLAIYDAPTVAMIAALQERYLQDCCPVTLAAWQAQSYVLRRFAERCVRLMSPLL